MCTLHVLSRTWVTAAGGQSESCAHRSWIGWFCSGCRRQGARRDIGRLVISFGLRGGQHRRVASKRCRLMCFRLCTASAVYGGSAWHAAIAGDVWHRKLRRHQRVAIPCKETWG
jgi:hypothetical protein